VKTEQEDGKTISKASNQLSFVQTEHENLRVSFDEMYATSARLRGLFLSQKTDKIRQDQLAPKAGEQKLW
jgi:hypothetical protein